MNLREIYKSLNDLLQKGERVAVATIVSVKGSAPRKNGAKMIVLSDKSTQGTIGGGIVEARVIEEACNCIRTRKIKLLHIDLNALKNPEIDMGCGGKMDVLVEPAYPPDPVVIFGCGHVGSAIYNILKEIDFEVTMVDDREKFTSVSRFPEAKMVICSKFRESFQALEIDENYYLIICTRAHDHDEECLRIALKSPAAYVGMLGSHGKVKRMSRIMEEEGIPVDRIKQIHAPIGLDIGAVTPAEIAISVAAEMIKFRMQRLQSG